MLGKIHVKNFWKESQQHSQTFVTVLLPRLSPTTPLPCPITKINNTQNKRTPQVINKVNSASTSWGPNLSINDHSYLNYFLLLICKCSATKAHIRIKIFIPTRAKTAM